MGAILIGLLLSLLLFGGHTIAEDKVDYLKNLAITAGVLVGFGALALLLGETLFWIGGLAGIGFFLWAIFSNNDPGDDDSFPENDGM